MTPPTVQFIPADASIWEFSGTYDSSFGVGGIDNNPNFTTPSSGFSGLVGFANRAFYGLMFIFDTSANRSAFLSTYPSNFGQISYRDTYSNIDMTSQSPWSWTLWDFGGTYRCYIPHTKMNNWVQVATPSSLPGQSYTMQAI